MNKNLEITLTNMSSYFENEEGHYNYVAKLIGPYKGYTARIFTENRSFYLTCYVDENMNVLIFEIEPGITCEQRYQNETAMMLCRINMRRLVTNFRMERGGRICIHSEQRFDDAPISPKTLGRMEAELMINLELSMDDIERVAHGNSDATSIAEVFKKLDDEETDRPQKNGGSKHKLTSNKLWEVLNSDELDSDIFDWHKEGAEQNVPFKENGDAIDELTESEIDEIKEMLDSLSDGFEDGEVEF